MSHPNSDHFSLSPAFLNTGNFALMAIPLVPEQPITEINQVSIPILITNDSKPPPALILASEPEKQEEPKKLVVPQIEDFEWISYPCERREHNYVNDFMCKKDPSTVNFKALDLVELEEVAIINVPKEFSSVAQDQYKRLLRFGGLDSNENIGMKSGALEKEHYNDKFNDFYDLNDPWINDEEEGQKAEPLPKNNERKESKKMAIVEVGIKDFFAHKGTLADFLNTAGYKERLKVLEEFNKEMEKEEKGPEKRKRPEKEKKGTTVKEEKKKEIKKKPQKKVKPSEQVEFLNSYPINNPFLATTFPDTNNFVVQNIKFNPLFCKGLITAPTANILDNISPNLLNDQFLEKLKEDQALPNIIDLNNLANNVGVDFFNLIINNGNNKLPGGFALPSEFQVQPSLNHVKTMEEREDKPAQKKKERSLDFKGKNDGKKNCGFPPGDGKGVYIEISENEDENEKFCNKGGSK